VGRDEEIVSVGRALGPATEGGPPETIIIYGKTGTGKSLVSRCTTRRAKERAYSNGHSLEYAYVDCSDYMTDASASREMANELKTNLGASQSIPRTGIASSSYRDLTWEMLDTHDVDAFVVILDEIDKLESEDLIRSLSRARETGKSDAYIGIICISNKIEYMESLGQRVDSSLQENELFFHPYNAEQLNNILENRRDAFTEGVLQDDVIPKAAAEAARYHGDARKAVDLLYEAGRLAEQQQSDTVTADHVDAAMKQVEVNRYAELISGTTPHVKMALRALALLTKSESQDSFRTHKIYTFYKQIAEKDGIEPLSEDRIRRLLKEQAFLGITESEHTSDGRGKGAYLTHRILNKPEIVIEALDEASED